MSVGPDLKQSILDLNLQLLSSSGISFLLLGRYLNIRFECILIPSWDSITYLLNQPDPLSENILCLLLLTLGILVDPSHGDVLPQFLHLLLLFLKLHLQLSGSQLRFLKRWIDIAWHIGKILLGIWRFLCGNGVKWSRTQSLENCLMWALCPRAIRT